jgi:hypothetical protein
MGMDHTLRHTWGRGMLDFIEVAEYLGLFSEDLWKLHPWGMWTKRMVAMVEFHEVPVVQPGEQLL